MDRPSLLARPAARRWVAVSAAVAVVGGSFAAGAVWRGGGDDVRSGTLVAAPDPLRPGPNAVLWTAAGAQGVSQARQTVWVTDTVPPDAACTPVPGTADLFRVSARDACTAPVIRLGDFVLQDGETVRLVPHPRPGVRLLRGTVKTFAVGPDDAAVTATDADGNTGRASCW